MTPYKELTGEKREKFKKWLKQFQKENDRSPTIEEVYDEATKELQAQIEKMKEMLKSDLIARLKENISYSTSPSCTKGMELFIKSIEEWEIKEND